MAEVDREKVWKSGNSDKHLCGRLAGEASPPQNLDGSGVPSGIGSDPDQ